MPIEGAMRGDLDFFNASQREIFAGNSTGPDLSFQRWGSMCVSCNAGGAEVFYYASDNCDPYSLVKDYELTKMQCTSDSGRDLTYISTCDVFTVNQCPQPPGGTGLRVIEHSDKFCESDPASDGDGTGYFVALNSNAMDTCIAVTEQASQAHSFAYAEDLFGLFSNTGSFKACCTNSTAFVYRFLDDSCTESEMDNRGLEFNLDGCHGQSDARIRYSAICADAVQSEECPPLIPVVEEEEADISPVASKASMRVVFEEDIAVVLASDESRAAFEDRFISTVSALLTVPADRIVVLDIVAGSFEVSFEVIAREGDSESAIARSQRLQTIIQQQQSTGGSEEGGTQSPFPSTFFGTALAAVITPDADDPDACDPPSECEWVAPPSPVPPPPPVVPEPETEFPIVPVMAIGAVLSCLLMVVGTLKSKAYKRWTSMRTYKQAAKEQASKAKQVKAWTKAEKEIRGALAEGKLLQQQADASDKVMKLFVEKSLAVLTLLSSESGFPLVNYLTELRQTVGMAQAGLSQDTNQLSSKLERVLSCISSNTAAAKVGVVPTAELDPPQVNNFVGGATGGQYARKAVEVVVDDDDEFKPLKTSDDASNKTVWIGKIPENCADGPSALTDALGVFGKVLSVTVRRKPGDCKSWALATFLDKKAAKAATMRAGLLVRDAVGKQVKLTIKGAKVDQELNKENTGALASMWASQEQKVAAAVRIQAAMRGSISRKRAGKAGGGAGGGAPRRRRSSTESEVGGGGRRRRSSVESDAGSTGGGRRRRSSVESDASSAGSGRRRRTSVAEKVVDTDADAHGSSVEAELTVWVGGLPESCAGNASALTTVLTTFGKVLSVTIRRKPGHRASWALASFVEKSAADKAIARGGVEVRDGVEKVTLVIKKVKIDAELRKKGTGALAATWANQEQKIAAAIRIQAVMRGSFSHKRNQKPMRRRSSERSSDAPVRRRSSAEREDNQAKSKQRSATRRGSVKEVKTMRRRRGSVEESVVDDDSQITPGSETTIWVGGLPENCADDPAAVTDALQVFGKVLSVTVRRKPGVCKSWAFATFVEHACSVQAVSSGAVTVADAEGQAVTLSLKAAKVDKELAKSSTGALASMWAGQEQKISAAIRIQAMVRGSNARRAKKHTRRRSGAHG
jgi:hypothetical protein